MTTQFEFQTWQPEKHARHAQAYPKSREKQKRLWYGHSPRGVLSHPAPCPSLSSKFLCTLATKKETKLNILIYLNNWKHICNLCSILSPVWFNQYNPSLKFFISKINFVFHPSLKNFISKITFCFLNFQKFCFWALKYLLGHYNSVFLSHALIPYFVFKYMYLIDLPILILLKVLGK